MRRTALLPLLGLLLVSGCSEASVADPDPSPARTAPLTPATPATPATSPTPTTSPTPAATVTADPDAIPTGAPSPAPSASSPPYALTSLGTFSSPVWVGPVPGEPGHLLLVEKTGRVLLLDALGQPLGVVLDLRAQVSHGNEQGLLSIALDPAYPTNHRLYADFTDRDGDTQVMAYTVRDQVAAGGQALLTVDQPFPNHNGGMLLFDRTGMLLVGLGDGGSAGDPDNRAQDLGTDLGKILRLNPRTGAAAVGNPFPQNPKVWALGLRNPLRFWLDSNGDLYLGDVGQNRVEELDVVPARFQRGANYGWSVFEGNDRFKADQQIPVPGPLIAPALTYPHAEGGCSITAGEVYRGTALPSLRGAFVFGDFCEGQLLEVRRTARAVTPSVRLGPTVQGLAAFGHDANGELLVLSADQLYRLVAGPA